MDKKLEGSVAIVTGGARGIGRETALVFAEQGARVAIIDIDDKGLEGVHGEMERLGGKVLVSKGDVTRSQEVRDFVSLVLERFGKIDVLVNNAAYVRYAPFLEYEEAEWEKVIAVCLKGYFLFSQAVAREMVKNRRGKIISMASVGGEVGFPGGCAYGPSKAGVIGLTKVMSVELAPFGIRVNAIAPGPIETEGFLETFNEASKQARIDRIPCGRLGRPRDVANAALFLASDDSNYVTGHVLHVDGGFLTAGVAKKG